MKRCPKCGETHPLTTFSKNRRRPDGLQDYCKPCSKAVRKPNREYHAEWQRNNKDKRNAYQRDYEERNRESLHPKIRARNTVAIAKRDGRIKPLDACEGCGSSESLEAHHPSYAKEMRLCVTWLCSPCHTQLHKEVANG